MSEKDIDLMKKLFRVVVPLYRYQAHNFRTFGPMANPHRGQGRVLSILKLQPEISQKELSYMLDMRSQSLGELLSKLERNGFITRTPSDEDRRVMIIKLTEAGKEAAGKVEQKSADTSEVFDCLNDEEQIKLGEFLDRIADALEQRLADGEVPEHHSEGPWGGHRHPHSPFDRRGGGLFGQSPFGRECSHSHGRDHDHTPRQWPEDESEDGDKA